MDLGSETNFLFLTLANLTGIPNVAAGGGLPGSKGQAFGVFGILAAVDTPIVYMANRWWRTQHPAPVIAGGAGSGLDARMALTLCITLAAFTLLYFYLWRMRCELERAGDVIETLQRQLQTQGMEVR